MKACDYLSKDIMVECNRPDVGLQKMGYIFNKEDVQDILTLTEGARGYKFMQDGKQPFNGTNSSLVVGKWRSYYTHQVKAVVFDKEVVEMLRGGKFVVVVDRGKTGDAQSNTSFECFGLRGGMTLEEATQDYYSEDTDAGWSILLAESNGVMAVNVFADMSYQDAKEALDAMCKEAASASVEGEVLIVDGVVEDEVLVLEASVDGEVLNL